MVLVLEVVSTDVARVFDVFMCKMKKEVVHGDGSNLSVSSRSNQCQ